jgi:acetolactate synthase-like protein
MDLTVSAIRTITRSEFLRDFTIRTGSEFLARKLSNFSLLQLGVAAAGIGFACAVFKEARIAFRSMPDEHSLSHGGEIVAKVLQAHGVKHIFTLIGGHISPILVASKSLGITVVDFRHEVNCVFAADAMSRLTGITGVAAVTAGPGVTNTITAVKNAQMAQSPLVLLGGAAPTILKASARIACIPPL